MLYDPKIFTIYEGIDKEKFIIALYHYQAEASDLLSKSGALAVEQTTGTWVPVPEETPEIRERCVGRVIGVYELPSYEDKIPADVKERKFIISVAYPIDNINYQIPELLTTLYGNISMVGKLKLLDVYLPETFVKKFKGPKFGVEGVRKLLGVKDRPIIVGMFKPCIGMSPETIGKMFYNLAIGGVDVVKDDELMADPEFCTVEARVENCVKAEEKAFKETGKHTLYTVNITDVPDKMLAKAKKAVSMGVNALMVNTYSVGYASLQMIADEPSINVPVLTHPSFGGTFFSSPDYGLTSHLVLGKLARLSGSDFVIYPSPYGKVPIVREKSIRISQELLSKFYHIKRAFPGPSAGMHPGWTPKFIEDFGTDLLVAAGGGIHGHPMGTTAGVKAFLQAIEATMKKIPLREYSKDHKELAEAIKLWGTYEDKVQNYDLTK